MTTTYSLDDLDSEGREALETLLFRLADDEFVTGERYTEWQVVAPTLESDLAISNIAQDEFGHARLWYDLLEEMGYTESELIYERDPTDFRHATLTELPIEEGEWANTIVRSYLYDIAEQLRLEVIEDSTYTRLQDRVGKVLSEEEYHREHAQNWLERIAESEKGRSKLQTATNDLMPYALTLFEPVDEEIETRIAEYGFRQSSLDELREQWLEIVVSFLDSLDITVNEPTIVDPVGRDGSHTEAWDELHDEITHTYHELGRSETTKIMEQPE